MNRKFSTANSSNDGVSNSSSREFRFSRLEPSRRHWSDLCSLNSSQTSRRFSLSKDRDGGFRNSKTVEVIDVDSQPYASCSTQGSQGIEVFEFSDEVFQEPKKLKESDFDPFEYNSSEELEGIVVPPRRKGGESEVFDFSEDGGFPKSKKLKIANFDPFDYNSSEELGEVAALPQRKAREVEGFDISEDVDFQKSKKLEKADYDPYEYNSSEELEGIVAMVQREVTDIGVFDFSKDVDLLKGNKCTAVGSDAFRRSSSQDLGIPQSRKLGLNGLSRVSLAEVSMKSQKKDRGKNWGLEKKKKKKKEPCELDPCFIELTDTSMEIQEFAETTEHNEVNSALHGLRKGQVVKIRRESLLSLLSICGTLQKRRLLWAHGMARKIIDAILGISIDDTPSNLAAAALFYLLTSDGQDEHLLYSPSSVRFLIKLLKPLSPAASKEKSQPIGSKLLGLCKNAGYSQISAKETDSTSTEVMLMVREILVDRKEIQPVDSIDGEKQEPELNPKWISLLTIEKACSSSITIEGFEDTSRTLQRHRSNFKKKLREFGGLDAVFEVARKCHSVMEEWLERSPSFALEPKNISGLESLVLLVKCLKIMENATFLSNDNQCHLLGMKGSFGGQQAPRSFTKLILSVIKILSGVSLLRSFISYGSNHSGGHSSMEGASYESFDQCDPRMISGEPRSTYSSVESSHTSSLKRRVESSQAVSRSGTSRSLKYATHVSKDDSGVESGTRNRKTRFSNSGVTEDSPDPFAFHNDDSEPSRWESRSGSMNKSLSRDGRATTIGSTDTSDFVSVTQQESNNVEYRHSQETSCSSIGDDDKSNLLAECLLTAIKVLMNLSNDNPEGCRQIARCGGLEILASLIAGHFPAFSLPLPRSSHARNGSLPSKSNLTIYHCTNTPLTDQELDFLIAILGLLVNLVEKDGGIRSQLAAASVSLPRLVGLDLKKQSNIIPILCSIFLANQGTEEAAGEEKCLSWEDEESILQGEKEAEKMIVEAYAALLLAFLSMESKKVRNTIAERLSSGNLKVLVPVLERFVEFHLTLNVISPETHSIILKVIESCKMP
ncbi:wings apart-like protein 2 isoform X1 [Salvia splendens]|uniref:wings apart-like protein 2 isoform X1 n=1 Tax=Salvia splendens TaxID=180675 RepID=UPI001C26CE11|nr:wings apart-like protein 2 isoform X1 [Salvia splendens]